MLTPPASTAVTRRISFVRGTRYATPLIIPTFVVVTSAVSPAAAIALTVNVRVGSSSSICRCLYHSIGCTSFSVREISLHFHPFGRIPIAVSVLNSGEAFSDTL